MHVLIATQLIIWLDCSRRAFSPVLCSWTQASFTSLDSQLCLTTSEKLSKPCPGSSSLCHCIESGNVLQAGNWDSCWDSFVCIQTVSNHCPSSPDGEQLEPHYVIYFVYCFIVLGGRVNLVLVTPHWPEVEVLWLTVQWIQFSLSYLFKNTLESSRGSNLGLPAILNEMAFPKHIFLSYAMGAHFSWHEQIIQMGYIPQN